MNKQCFAVFAVALTVLAGCSSNGGSDDTKTTTPAPVRSYVGTAEGTAAFVAVVVDGSNALAYVCDGMPGDPVGTTPTLQAWFNGASDGTTVDLTGPNGRLQAQLTAAAVTGTLTLADGRKVPVTGHAATGDAGLYRADAAGNGAKAVAGWILTADGQQRGGVGGGGSLATLSGTKTLVLTQPTFSLQGLAAARIAKVGITPIPIP